MLLDPAPSLAQVRVPHALSIVHSPYLSPAQPASVSMNRDLGITLPSLILDRISGADQNPKFLPIPPSTSSWLSLLARVPSSQRPFYLRPE